jgi:hypothetical protein
MMLPSPPPSQYIAPSLNVIERIWSKMPVLPKALVAIWPASGPVAASAILTYSCPVLGSRCIPRATCEPSTAHETTEFSEPSVGSVLFQIGAPNPAGMGKVYLTRCPPSIATLRPRGARKTQVRRDKHSIRRSPRR